MERGVNETGDWPHGKNRDGNSSHWVSGYFASAIAGYTFRHSRFAILQDWMHFGGVGSSLARLMGPTQRCNGIPFSLYTRNPT